MAYFSNGSEGMHLENQCADCPIGEEACPVYGVQLLYNYKQLEPGNEDLRAALNMLIDKKGICQLRKTIIEQPNKARENENELASWNQAVMEFNNAQKK